MWSRKTPWSLRTSFSWQYWRKWGKSLIAWSSLKTWSTDGQIISEKKGIADWDQWVVVKDRLPVAPTFPFGPVLPRSPCAPLTPGTPIKPCSPFTPAGKKNQRRQMHLNKTLKEFCFHFQIMPYHRLRCLPFFPDTPCGPLYPNAPWPPLIPFQPTSPGYPFVPETPLSPRIPSTPGSPLAPGKP